MLAKRVEFEEDANREALKGTITSVDGSTQFHMVVFNENLRLVASPKAPKSWSPFSRQRCSRSAAKRWAKSGGFSIPGLSFASGADLLVGQDVQIRPGTVSSSGGVTTITTDLVRLWPSQITGQVGSAGVSNGTFALTGLSSLFTGATPPITSITVVMLSEMTMMDDSGTGSLAAGQTVSVKGLLFNTSGTPTLVTRTLREH